MKEILEIIYILCMYNLYYYFFLFKIFINKKKIKINTKILNL